jgi:hypothetical protein
MITYKWTRISKQIPGVYFWWLTHVKHSISSSASHLCPELCSCFFFFNSVRSLFLFRCQFNSEIPENAARVKSWKNIGSLHVSLLFLRIIIFCWLYSSVYKQLFYMFCPDFKVIYDWRVSLIPAFSMTRTWNPVCLSVYLSNLTYLFIYLFFAALGIDPRQVLYHLRLPTALLFLR